MGHIHFPCLPPSANAHRRTYCVLGSMESAEDKAGRGPGPHEVTSSSITNWAPAPWALW